ncbi:MAG TPA: hypothetical protein VJ865_03125 [Gemmatimonadaceae bacterium]|nr:hypothetical protein [Gemmatimonadaceae bacterium]
MKSFLTGLAAIGAVLMASTSTSAQSAVRATNSSERTFKQLASLVGVWEGVEDGVPFQVSYTLSGAGTALMEEVRPGDPKAMLTLFTVDGDHLVATHYCVVGNQPQMVSGVPDDLHKGVVFTLARVTGMKTPDAWHNTGLTFTLDDNDHLTQRWTYLYKGQAGSTVFHYTRKK